MIYLYICNCITDLLSSLNIYILQIIIELVCVLAWQLRVVDHLLVITVLSDVFHTPRYTLPEYKVDFDMSLEADYEERLAGNIRELLSLRDSTNSNFTFSELNEMITFSGLFMKHMYSYIYYLCLTVCK